MMKPKDENLKNELDEYRVANFNSSLMRPSSLSKGASLMRLFQWFHFPVDKV